MDGIILYSDEFNETVLIEFKDQGNSVAVQCSDQFSPRIMDWWRAGLGFIYSADWILVGYL